MKDMFCFQCEQTAKGTGCEVKGVCGKTAPVAGLQDKLVGAAIGLARAVTNTKATDATDDCIVKALFTTVTNVSFDDESLNAMVACIEKMKADLDPTAKSYDMTRLWEENEDIRSLKTLILLGVKGMASYAHHAAVLGYKDPVVNAFFYKALVAVGSDMGMAELLPLVLETGTVNLACMGLLDKANTETYGTPIPTVVTMTIEKGPFIIITGHDLRDLHLLLEQTKNKGINVYTHGEMLPTHAYPILKKYPQLKGNFGTAWQNQQKEFDNVPAPILFTTNCLMPVKDSYADRVFTTDVVQYPSMVHIGKDKDFTPVIEKALALDGYKEDQERTGINGGKTLMTGFGHGTVLSVADKVIAAVKAGDIKHFFLVGGCDGAKTGRNYYTEFVEKAPKESIILTLACGKYRFNDLDLGTIGVNVYGLFYHSHRIYKI